MNKNSKKLNFFNKKILQFENLCDKIPLYFCMEEEEKPNFPCLDMLIYIFRGDLYEAHGNHVRQRT